MATYQQSWNELMSLVPKLSPPLAQKFIQRAWRDIRDSRLWSFLVDDTTIDVPVQITTGTATATQGSAIVTGDANAIAAWNAVTNADFITRQFRIGTGPIYIISSYASPNITLERPYTETSVAGGVYSIYKCYYTAPTNFLRWHSVFDPIDGYQLTTDYTKARLDHTDPIRGAIGQPFVIASYKYDTSEAPLSSTTGHLYELYPHPIVQRSYPALYQKRGIDFATPTESFPDIIPDEVIMMRAKYWAYEWAAANSAAHAELRGVNWQYLRAQVDTDYRKDLFKAQKQDEELFSQNFVESYVTNKWRRVSYDGNYAQNHAPMVGWYR